MVTGWTVWRHKKKTLVGRLESPPPPKRCRINSPASHSRTDAGSSSSDHHPPQLHAPPFEFNPSLPLLDPSPASNLLQSPGDSLTEAPGPSVDNVPLDLHAQTHRTADQSDDEDSEDALEEDAVEAADSVDYETDDFWNGENIAMEGDVDPHEGIVSDWDLLAEEFIVQAEELGKFEHSLLHAP